MCRALEVNASGYYAWRGRKPSARAKENERLREQITAIDSESRATYGSPKVARKLRRDGEAVNHKRVERLRREEGLKAKRVKKFRQTTSSRHSLPVAENVLARNFTASSPHEVWTSDITYIWTQEGWLYLVVFLDLYSRLVVGWAVSESLTSEARRAGVFASASQTRNSRLAACPLRPRQPIRQRRFHAKTGGVGLPAKHES